MALPNQPNASKWLAQAVFEFKWMLANGVMEDGQWHAPTRAALSCAYPACSRSELYREPLWMAA